MPLKNVKSMQNLIAPFSSGPFLKHTLYKPALMPLVSLTYSPLYGAQKVSFNDSPYLTKLIPDELKELKSLELFKEKVKKFAIRELSLQTM